MHFTATRLSIVLLAAAGMCFATPANADWISDKLSDSCSGASAGKLSQSVRDNIEDSMKRAESSIKPPSPVGDLGCLEDLMGDVGINIFSAEQGGDFGGSMASGLVQQLMGSLGDQLGGAGLGDMLDASGDPMGAICKFAEEKWGELSGSLGMGDMKLPPDLGSVMNLGNFNLPGGNGSGNGGGRGGVLGKTPDPSPSPTAPVPGPTGGVSTPDPSPSPMAPPTADVSRPLDEVMKPGIDRPLVNPGVSQTDDAISQLWRDMAAPGN